MGEVPTRKHPKWRNRTSDRESDGRFWIWKPSFLFEFPSNHTSISLSFRDIHVWQSVRQTDRRTTWTITIAGPCIVEGQLRGETNVSIGCCLGRSHYTNVTTKLNAQTHSPEMTRLATNSLTLKLERAVHYCKHWRLVLPLLNYPGNFLLSDGYPGNRIFNF